VSAVLGVLPALLLTRLTRSVLSLLLLAGLLLRPTALLLAGLLVALLLLTRALIGVLILVHRVPSNVGLPEPPSQRRLPYFRSPAFVLISEPAELLAPYAVAIGAR
jgi:hypothetical protein